MLKEGVRVLVMVKAEAYGNGATEVAQMLEGEDVAYLGVAYVEEGLRLRRAGIRLPILVLNPSADSFGEMGKYELEPAIYSLSLLRRFLDRLPEGPAISGIHLKLDTGMHRLGLEPADLQDCAALLKQHPELRVISVFSHLSAGEDAGADAFTRLQGGRFREMYEQLAESLGYRPMAHLLSSEGTARFPEFQFDMVRLGIGFYGLSMQPDLQAKLRPASRLKTTISQIKTVEAGEPVGYGLRAATDTDRRIATLSLGYEDGLLRLAGNGRFSVLLRGERAPTVGNICMDMCMIDITHIPEAEEGDEVIVFGPEKPVQELAEALQTIPYEVLTNVSERVGREYL